MHVHVKVSPKHTVSLVDNGPFLIVFVFRDGTGLHDLPRYITIKSWFDSESFLQDLWWI